MKNKSIEKTFRQKLEDLRIEPSAIAKERVYNSIHKQSRIRLYKRISIAAGIIFILSVGLFLFSSDKKPGILVRGEQKIPDSGEAGNPIQMREGTPERSNSIIIKEQPVSAKNEQDHSDATSITQGEVNRQNEPAATAAILPDTIQVTKPLALVTGEKGKGTDGKRPDGPVEHLDFGPNDGRSFDSASSLSIVGAKELSEAEHSDIIGTGVPETGKTVTDSKAKDQKGQENKRDPLKITIEYIASGPETSRQNARTRSVKGIYDKVNKLVYPEAIIGDIRTFKDQLFALDFIEDITSETQNKNKK